MNQPTRILLVDDNPHFLEAARDFLQVQEGISVVGVAINTEDAIAQTQKLEVDVILLDLNLADSSGLDLIPIFKTNLPEARIIILTMMDEKSYRSSALQAGADDFVPKNEMGARLVAVIRELMGRSEPGRAAKLEHAAQGLFERDEQLAGIVNSTTDGLIMIDEEHRIQLFNPAAEKLFGCPASEVVGSTLDRFIPAPARAKHREYVRDFGASGETWRAMRKPNLELNCLRANGETFPADISISYFEINGSKRFIASIRDITERKQTEKLLHESEDRFRSTFEQAAVGIAHVGTDGKWLRVNQKICDIVGYTREELIQKTFQDITHPDDLETDLAHVRQMLKDEIKTYSMEKRYIRKDGSIVWINLTVSLVRHDTGEPNYFISVIEDITEQKRSDMALRDSEAELRALFSAMRDVVIVYDEDGRYVKIAPTRPGLLIRPPAELLGKTLNEVLPGEQAQAILARIRSVIETRQTEDFEYALTIEGRETWFSASISPLNEKHVVWVAHDVTARKQAENKVARLYNESQRRFKEVEALHSIDIAISSSTDLRLTLNLILNHVESLLGADAADILLFNSDLQEFKFSAGRGFHTAYVEQANVRLSASLAGQVALKRKPVIVSAELAARADRDFSEMYKKEGFAAYAGVPLITKGHVKGVLEVYRRSPHSFEQEWVDFLETLAGQTAIAVDNAQLFDHIHQSNLQLVSAYDATIEGWSRAMDMRDKETEGHTQRVTALTLKLARAMNFSESQLTHIRRGALLHDIGKMGVPDHILLKSDGLTEEEWAAMRKHPQFAFDLLAPIDFLREALDIPYCHHERWDGAGYPRGLKAEQIPLTARIFAIVDVYDALTSDRPYRAAWTKEKTLEYIRSEAGAHFDPMIVEKFLKLMGME